MFCKIWNCTCIFQNNNEFLKVINRYTYVVVPVIILCFNISIHTTSYNTTVVVTNNLVLPLLSCPANTQRSTHTMNYRRIIKHSRCAHIKYQDLLFIQTVVQIPPCRLPHTHKYFKLFKKNLGISVILRR